VKIILEMSLENIYWLNQHEFHELPGGSGRVVSVRRVSDGLEMQRLKYSGTEVMVLQRIRAFSKMERVFRKIYGYSGKEGEYYVYFECCNYYEMVGNDATLMAIVVCCLIRFCHWNNIGIVDMGLKSLVKLKNNGIGFDTMRAFNFADENDVVFAPNGMNNEYSCSSNVYSVGILVFLLFYPVFYDGNQIGASETLSAFVSGEFSSIMSRYHPAVSEIIYLCMKTDNIDTIYELLCSSSFEAVTHDLSLFRQYQQYYSLVNFSSTSSENDLFLIGFQELLSEKPDHYLIATCFCISAGMGYPESNYHYGFLLCKGIRNRIDENLAFKYFETAFGKGNYEACFKIGEFYYKGRVVGKDIKKAKIFLSKAFVNGIEESKPLLDSVINSLYPPMLLTLKRKADEGDSYAQLEVARLFLNSEGNNDEVLGNYYLDLSMANNNTNAFIEKGMIIINRDVNDSKGYDLLIKAFNKGNSKAKVILQEFADRGIPQAMFSYYMLWYNSKSDNVDTEQLIKYLSGAAEKNLVEAQYHYGIALGWGIRLVVNSNKAARYLKLASDSGNSESQFLMYLLLETGIGVEKNTSEAIEYLRKANENGNEIAISHYPKVLSGQSTDSDVLEILAEMKMPDAQWKYGLFLLNKDSSSNERALELCESASKAGVKEAKLFLDSYSKERSLIDELDKNLLHIQLFHQLKNTNQVVITKLIQKKNSIFESLNDLYQKRQEKWKLKPMNNVDFGENLSNMKNNGITPNLDYSLDHDLLNQSNNQLILFEPTVELMDFPTTDPYRNIGLALLLNISQSDSIGDQIVEYINSAVKTGLPLANSIYEIMNRYGSESKDFFNNSKEVIKKDADDGCIQSQFVFGCLVLKSSSNSFEAIEYFRKSAEHEFCPSLFACAMISLSPENKDSMMFLLKAAMKGHSTSLKNYITVCISKELPITSDLTSILQLKAKNDDSLMNMLGLLYQHGIGFPKDHSKSKECFRLSSQKSNPEGMNNYAVSIFQENMNEAIKLLEQAVHLGSINAKINIAILCYHGIGVQHDFIKAYQFFRETVSSGNPICLMYMGLMEINGYGTQISFESGITFLHISSEYGHAPSQALLGQIMLRNQMDFPKAISLLQESANNGSTNGQYLFGYALVNGIACEKNICQGMRFLKSASEHGHLKAKEFYSLLLIKYKSDKSSLRESVLHLETCGKDYKSLISKIKYNL